MVDVGPETRPPFRPARGGEHLVSSDPIFPSSPSQPLADDPDAQLEIQAWRLGPLRVLRLVGELDVFTVPGVQAKLEEVLLAFDGLTLIVDLTRLTFMGSTGVRVLLEIREKVAARRGRLIVVLAPGSNPRRLFELTRVMDHFEIAETLKDTVRALRQAQPDLPPWDAADEIP
jgi:anti-anti-sigma factor